MKFFFCLVLGLGCLGECLQAQSIFDRWDKNGDGKLVESELPPNARRNFSKVDTNQDGSISRAEDKAFRTRGRNQPKPDLEGLIKHADLDYAGTDNPKQKLDLYLPAKPASTDPLPVVCWIHGGGWRNGDKANARRVMPFVNSGKYAAVSIGYRLTGEAQWPAQIHDCKAAIRFLKANAGKYHLDPDKIAVFGSSAGGHLVAMLGLTGGNQKLEGEIGNYTEQSSTVNCVVDYFGPTELLKMNEQGSTMDHDAADSPEGRLVGGALADRQEVAKEASPIHHVSADDRPMLIVHGKKDPLVPFQQSVDLVRELRSVNVPVTFISVEKGGHGNGFPPEINQLVELYLKSQLYGGDVPEDRQF